MSCVQLTFFAHGHFCSLPAGGGLCFVSRTRGTQEARMCMYPRLKFEPRSESMTRTSKSHKLRDQFVPSQSLPGQCKPHISIFGYFCSCFVPGTWYYFYFFILLSSRGLVRIKLKPSTLPPSKYVVSLYRTAPSSQALYFATAARLGLGMDSCYCCSTQKKTMSHG